MAKDTPGSRKRNNEPNDNRNISQNKNNSSNRNNYLRTSSNWVLIIALVILFLLGLWLFLFRNYNVNDNNQNGQQYEQQNQQTTIDDDFRDETRSPNFSKSVPNHGETLPAPPVNIYIVTNSASSVDGTQLRIMNGNKDYGTGDTLIGLNGTTLRKNMDSNSPDGLYTVEYRSCGQDKHCQIGNFQFKIDRSKANSYTDLRNKGNVTISIANSDFNPKNIRISKGTKVTWTNNNTRDFVIISGTNDTRTYFANLTSSSIPVNSSFSFTFDTVGYIPYRAITEGETINGSIIIE